MAQMNDTDGITYASVLPSQSVVGAKAYYTVELSAPTSLINGDIISVTFPPELNTALVNTLSYCTGASNMASSL